ncbi:hypothetical protein TSOC_009944 [Tetrabaena socialis]|uniref:Uncharacterized protein n=1 Tax=Tetrabaena socialis TaxID=47790 RepID=A0A2J7ZUK0_9CHLO|nr:hypothetical protein TSOC_009944 [Tetrabaena socialis]|eukprot:PNH03951.1 hypothetical protein TSOC_009944 [Tetrabaena socialis]
MSRCSDKLLLLNLLSPDRATGSGPVRRFPSGFWATFNLWWHGEFARQGQRPSSMAISKWHTDNAFLVWGDQAVNYAETQRHANRMKCRRSGAHLQSKRGGQDEDDDDAEDDCLMDTAVVDRDNAPTAAMMLDTAADSSSGASGASPAAAAGPPLARARSSRRGLDLSAHSDPPGAVFGGLALGMYSDPPRAPAGLGGALAYLNADSDVPAPAAAAPSCPEPLASPLLLGCGGGGPAYVKLECSPPWMQPDPTGPMNALGPLSGPASSLSGGLSWDSSFSVVGQPAGTSAGYPLQYCSSFSGAVYGAAPRAARGPKRVRPALECGASDAAAAPESYLRTNPFGELSAAAGASAGLQAASAPPAALDAAALLGHGGAAMSHMSYMPPPPVAAFTLALHMQQQPPQQQQQQQVDEPGVAPAWMRNAAAELETLLAELGIGCPPAGQQQQQDQQHEQALAAAAAPLLRSALHSSEPLSLPPPRPQRGGGGGMDALLTRGLGRLDAARGGNGMSIEQVREQLLRRGGGGGGGSGCSSLPRTSGLEGLMAIDSMPIEALLV